MESEPGKGSTFCFTLPVRVEAQAGKHEKRILVVEDQQDNRCEICSRAPISRSSKPRMARRVAAAAAHRPDLILIDIQLPGLDGYEATRRLKADGALHAIPIIAVTSYGLAGDAEKARAAGCDAY